MFCIAAILQLRTNLIYQFKNFQLDNQRKMSASNTTKPQSKMDRVFTFNIDNFEIKGVNKRMSGSVQDGDLKSPKNLSRQTDLNQEVFSQESSRQIEQKLKVQQETKKVAKIDLRQISLLQNNNIDPKQIYSKSVTIKKEQESEEELQNGQGSPNISLDSAQYIKQSKNNLDVKHRTVNLGTQPSLPNLTQRYESMYARSEQSVGDSTKIAMKAKMSSSDKMIFETRQLQRANLMILNQPDRKIHDYSQAILQDKFPVISTYEDQDYKRQTGNKINDEPQNSTGLDLTPLSDKSTPWDTIWSGIRKWREKNVQYEKLDIQPYEVTSADLMSEAFGESLSKSKKFENRDIDNDMALFQNTSNINIQVHYEEVFDTGEKFLRIATRQWTNGFDPKTVKNKEQIEYEIQTLRCYKYCQSTEEDFLVNEFDLQHSSIYDVSEKRLSIEDGAFSNDFFMAFRNHTFFFQRVENGFQLVRQSMMEPQYLPGPTKDQVCEASSDVQQIENFFIQIDDPENYQINFVKPASKQYSLEQEQSKSQLEFLLDLFVLVKEKRYLSPKNNIDKGRLRVYTLMDPAQPVIDETIKNDFSNIQAAFHIDNCSRTASDECIIIIRCSHSEHQFTIDHFECSSKRSYKIKTLYRDTYVYRRYLTHQIKIVHKLVNLNDGSEPFHQTYAVSVVDQNYMPFPIYPMHQEREKGKIGYNACQSIQNIFRENYAGSPEGQIIFDEDNHFQNVTESHKDNLFYELKDKAHLFYHGSDQFIATNTTIIKGNVFQGIIHTWLTFRDHTYSNFHDKIKDLKEFSEGLTFKKRLYEQFSRSNRVKYQNNFSTCASTKECIPNMNLQPIYIHQSKQNVMSYHNKLFVNEKCFEFHEKYLLLDLNQKGGMFIKIQLFDNETQDVRLLKYHSDPKSQKVVLFFLQRNHQSKNNGNQSKTVQSGVYFFTVTTFAQLNLLSNNHNLQSYLLCKETTIQVMIKIDKFVKMKYDQEILSQYQGYGKFVERTLNHLSFEMVHDMLNPVQNWLPFIFSDLNSDRVGSYFKNQGSNQDKFSTYLCFMNLSKYKIQYGDQDDKEDQNDPNELIQKHYLQQFLNSSDKKRDIKTLHRYNQSNAEWSLSMFSRSSNWQENIYQQESSSYSARFQIGLSNRSKDVQVFESQEMIVTIQDDCMKTEPLALRHIFPSRQLYGYCQMNKEKAHLHRFVPEIDDRGNINGCSMMVCVQVYNTFKQNNPVIKNSDQENANDLGSISKLTLIEDYHKVRKLFSMTKKYENFIENRVGAKVEVTEESSQNVEVQFEDNVRKVIAKNMIQEFEGGKYVADTQEYEYGIVPLYGDKEIILRTPLMQMGYRKYVLLNRTNEFMLVHTSRVNSKIMLQQFFDKNELLIELYRSQKKNICMSLPNFEEVTKLSVIQRQKVYFQHRYIFNGRNYCGIDLPHYKSDIDILKASVSDSCLNRQLIEAVPNSCFKYVSGYNPMIDNENCDTRVETLFYLFDCNRLHNFQLNLNHESFLQKSLDNNYARALYFLLDFILEKKNDIIYQEVVMEDLPQMISQDKVPVLEFFCQFDEDQKEDENNKQQKQKKRSRHVHNNNCIKEPCNIETRLNSQELPFLGTDEQTASEFKCFVNVFDIEEEIVNGVVSNAKDIQIKLQNESTEQEFMDQEENQQEIEHDYINFQPLIRKIKIDKIMNRKSNILKGTSYLEKFDENPKYVNSISDLFLAYMMQQRKDAPEFYAQKSVQKLIDRQYVVTKDVIFKLLVIYLFGFIIPFAVNIYYQGNLWFQVILTSSGLMTQIFFLTLEYPEFQYKGAEAYLQDTWNIIDCTQIIFYLGRVILNIFVDEQAHNYTKLVRNILTIICLLQSMLKLLYYIKYKEQFCFLVQMLTQVFKDLYPFMTIFMINVYIFSMVDFVMDTDMKGEEYQNMTPTFRVFIQVFRQSIGDISAVQVNKWTDKNDEMISVLASAIVWTFWFINVFSMTIVFLNFVIAEVGNTYNDIKSSGTIFIYQKKAEMNFVAQIINCFFGKQTKFVALVFITPKSMGKSYENNDLQNFSTKLKKDIQTILSGHQQEIYQAQIKYEANYKELSKKMDLVQKFLAQQDDIEEKKAELMDCTRHKLEKTILSNFIPNTCATGKHK